MNTMVIVKVVSVQELSYTFYNTKRVSVYYGKSDKLKNIVILQNVKIDVDRRQIKSSRYWHTCY